MYKRQVYYSSAYDLACVATEEDGVFTCCDFFGTGRCTLEPVSYTHLDVYKRQKPMFLESRTVLAQPHTVTEAPSAGADAGRNGILPVSYTHLDVYKRQGPCRKRRSR